MRKEMVVGAVFMLALCITIFGAVAISGLDIFTPTATWHVKMKDVGGLKKGDEVRVLGSPMGTVKAIRFDTESYIFRLSLKMDADAPIREGYRIAVRDHSALGGKYLAVDPGDPASPQADVDLLEGSASATDLMGGAQDVLTELRKSVEAINRGEGTLGSIIFKEDIYRDVKDASASLKTIAARLEAGEGSVGALLRDQELYEQLRQLVARLNSADSALGKLSTKESGEIVDNLVAASQSIKSILAKADAGDGSLAKLLNDDALYSNASGAIATANHVMEDVRAGRGVAGMLISDAEARKNLGDALASIQAMLAEAKDGKGTVGRLLADEELYRNLSSVAEHLNSAAERLDKGSGTVAKLINDPTLHDMVKKLLAKAVEAIENARDSAPVSAILSAIGAPFQ